MDDEQIPDADGVTITVESDTTTEETPEQKAQREADEKLLAKARRQLRTCMDAEKFYRTEADKDTRFRAGKWGEKSYQWPDGVEEWRRARSLPCLTVNRAPGFIQQVTNQARNAHLRIIVSPVGDRSDKKVAEVLQGIIRNIETTSYADRAYNRASDKQAEIGRGGFTLALEWEGDEGEAAFRQRIRIKQERNPLQWYLDPARQEPDNSDVKFAFKIIDIDRGDFKDVMGDDPPAENALAGFDSTEGPVTGDWFPNGKIRVAMWYHREPDGPGVRMAKLSDGTVVRYPTTEAELVALEASGLTIKLDRWVQKKVIRLRKITATKIYETSVWPADAPPHIEVVGQDIEIDGERDWRGVIRDSAESGRVYNVHVSGLVQLVGMGQRAPVVGYRGQFGAPDSDMRRAWETANTEPKAFLEVEPLDIDGQGKAAPIPGRVLFEPPIEGTIAAIHQSDEDYKSTAGFRDASLGERGPQESGKAILARQRQDELGSSHYLDNLRFALVVSGRQMIQLIRKVMDVPQVVHIVGDDNTARKVMVFSGAQNDPRNPEYLDTDPATNQPVPFQMPEGVKEIFDLSVGEYHVEVSAGRDDGTRRQEAVEALTDLFKGMPPEISVKFIDLYFSVMDFPLAAQMAARAKKMLPPEFQDDEDGAENQIPPQVKAQVAAMAEKFKELMAAYQQAQQELETDRAKANAQIQMKRDELASNEKIAALDRMAELIRLESKTDADKALALMKAEIDRLKALVQMGHEARMAHDERTHDGALALIDAAHTAAPVFTPPVEPEGGSDAAGGDTGV